MKPLVFHMCSVTEPVVAVNGLERFLSMHRQFYRLFDAHRGTAHQWTRRRHVELHNPPAPVSGTLCGRPDCVQWRRTGTTQQAANRQVAFIASAASSHAPTCS